MMNEKRDTVGSFAALFLSVFFAVIVLFYMFSFLKVTDHTAFWAAITFAVINLLIIILLTSCEKLLVHKLGIPSYKEICTATIIYSVFQFIHMGLQYDSKSVTGYILYHLIILFLYLMIVVPLGIMGMNSKNVKAEI
jgi:hypothetical protein